MFQVPHGPSSYVGNILKPLKLLRGEIPVDYEQEWVTSIVEQVTDRYVCHMWSVIPMCIYLMFEAYHCVLDI